MKHAILEGSGSKRRPTKYMTEESFKKCISSNFHLTSEQVVILLGIFAKDSSKVNWQKFLRWCGATDADDSSRDAKTLATMGKKSQFSRTRSMGGLSSSSSEESDDDVRKSKSKKKKKKKKGKKSSKDKEASKLYLYE